MKHKHCELIKAWADGAEIQGRYFMGGNIQEWTPWQDEHDPNWNITEEFEYRIKPEPKPDVVKIFRLEAHAVLGLRFQDHTEPLRKNEQYIKIVFNDEKL